MALRDGRRLRHLVAAALVACYGILCLIATGPHAHGGYDFRLDAAREKAFAPDGTAGRTNDTGGVRSDCPLCSWTRGLSRPQPAFVAAAPCIVSAHQQVEHQPAGAAPPTL